MKLFAAVFARRAVEFRREPPGEPVGTSHAERVSISEDASTISQAAARPAVGDVRWYRATRGAAARARVAAARDAHPAEGASAGPLRPATAAGAAARVAIAAYRAGMALGIASKRGLAPRFDAW